MSNPQNLIRSVNQIQNIGVTNPPNLGNIPDSLLNKASPTSFNLTNNTKVNKNVSDQASAKCRQFKDINGLRQLSAQESNRTYYDTGCGWIYKPSTGLYPTMNQGAIGTASGALTDSVGGGVWYWDLEKAEKEITQKICLNASKCSQLKNLGKYKDICGYCKTSGAIIPVQKNGSQMIARFPNDPSLKCEMNDIVTAGRGVCPAEGFSDYAGSSVQIGLGVKGDLEEGFLTIDDMEKCKGNLTRDCAVLAARMAGCSDKGTLITSMLEAKQGANYDDVLKTKMSYMGYQQSAMPSLSASLFSKTGRGDIDVALTEFGGILENTSSENNKVRLAARDLCLMSGEYDAYNFCAELTGQSVLNSNTIVCAQNDWKRNGGTEKGSSYPTLKMYNSKRWNDYIKTRDIVMNRVKSKDRNTNARGLAEFVGISMDKQIITLPMNDFTRGAETVWIDLVDTIKGTSNPSIILKCDLRLSSQSESIPSFSNGNELIQKWKVPNNNIAFMNAYEIRPIKNTDLQFSIKSDDGFMVGINQNPFQNASNKGLLESWGSWLFQGAKLYTSPKYTLESSQEKTNTIVMTWFQGRGPGTFLPSLTIGGKVTNPNGTPVEKKDIYLTQEPLAPWLQYEICSRPNLGNGSKLGFFEKRWNGPISYVQSTKQKKYSFDVKTSSGIVYDQKDKSITMMTGSYWHSSNHFAFTAFKTITVLFYPEANLAKGIWYTIFGHQNFGGNGMRLYLSNNNGNYSCTFAFNGQTQEINVSMNKWNLAVFQYIGDENGIRNINCSIGDYDFMKTTQGRKGFFQEIQQKQSSGATGGIVIGSPLTDRKNAGYLYLGARSEDFKDASGNVVDAFSGFVGKVKWIHGFRNYLDTEDLLKTEIEQKWLSRWPVTN